MELKNDQFSEEMADISGKIDLKLKDVEKVLTIVGIDKGTPKEVLTANLAVNWSQYLKVLIIDLNFGKKTFQSIFKEIDNFEGVSNFLLAHNETRPDVMKTQFSNLYYLPAGEVVDNVNLRLQSRRFMQMISYFKENFDRIIINDISTNNLDNLIVPMKISDTSVVVVSKKYSKKRQITKIAAMIQDLDVKNLGAVYIY